MDIKEKAYYINIDSQYWDDWCSRSMYDGNGWYIGDSTKLHIYDEHGETVETIDISSVEDLIGEWWGLEADNRLDGELTYAEYYYDKDNPEVIEGIKQYEERSKMKRQKIVYLIGKIAEGIQELLPYNVFLFVDYDLYGHRYPDAPALDAPDEEWEEYMKISDYLDEHPFPSFPRCDKNFDKIQWGLRIDKKYKVGENEYKVSSLSYENKDLPVGHKVKITNRNYPDYEQLGTIIHISSEGFHKDFIIKTDEPLPDYDWFDFEFFK